MLNYRREIDGLRALAVVPVILFHAGFPTFSGGFVGVDVFFVISGYLITSIILAEIEQEKFSIAGFYERRARRILPALFFVILISLPFAFFLLIPSHMLEFSKSIMHVVSFTSNIFFYVQSGYFDTEAELKPMLHTWSLAVEEQFYLFFPLFLYGLWRFGKKLIMGLLVIFFILSLLYAEDRLQVKPEAAFFLLGSRFWELLVGAFISFYFFKNPKMRQSKELNQIGSMTGLILILYAILTFSKQTSFPGYYALVPTLGAALIVLFASKDTIAGGLLSKKVFVGIGLISYSAYLWHYPLFVFARYLSEDEPSKLIFVVLIIICGLLAWITYRYIESPFRNKKLLSRKSIFTFSVAGSLMFALLGWIGQSANGFEAYYLSHRLSDKELETYNLIKKNTGKNISIPIFDNGNCNFWSDGVTQQVMTRFEECASKYGKATIIIGDSHAINIYNVLAKSDLSQFLLGVSKGGCRPDNKKTLCYYEEFDKFLIENSAKIKTVIYHQSGSYFIKDRYGEVDSKRAFEANANFIFDLNRYSKTASYLNQIGQYARVIWLGPFVEARVDFKNLRSLSAHMEMSEKSLEQFRLLEDELKKQNQSASNEFRYVSMYDMLNADRNFLLIGSCITYKDTDHLSTCGENLVAERVRKKLRDSLKID